MDTPKPFLALESFPPEIWAYFVWYLPGEQLLRLLLTGSAFLMRRLKSPKVVRSVTLGKNFMTFVSLPRVFSELSSLEELSIYSCDVDWSRNFRLTIESIPSGVRKLELSGDWVNSSKLFGEEGATLKLDEHLPHLESLHLYGLLFANNSWMTHSPQSLTSLSLDRWTGEVDLPPTLVHFKAHLVALSAHSMVSQLPSLESFTAVQLNGVEWLVPLLPASTLKLCLGKLDYYAYGTAQLVRLEQLPKSLTCLKVPARIKFGPKPEVIASLPSTLTKLSMAPEIPCSAWHLVPQNLTKLSVRAREPIAPFISKINGKHREMTSFPFGALPRSLTSFSLSVESIPDQAFCAPPAPAAFHQTYFPPQLTSLKIPEIQLSPGTAKLLPSSLLLLELGNFCERVCKHLPNGLQKLISQRTLVTPKLIKFLPKTLIHLELSCQLDTSPWFDYKTGKRLETLSKLKEHSIHKKCISNKFDWRGTSPLPSTLTYFHLSNDHELGDSFLAHQHLPNLMELNLYASKYFSDLCIPLLSSHLKSLRLSSSSKISGKSFEFLPRCLTYLNLYASESIFDPDIQRLPRTLEYANLSHAIHLTDLCVPDLPPHLETLYLSYNTQITPSSYPNFPYPMRSSQRSKTLHLASWSIERGVVRQR